MAGAKGRSGGWNRLSAEQHLLRGTWRKDRHGRPAAPVPVSTDERQRAVTGLSPKALAMADQLLALYDGWDASSLVTLRAYCLSAERLDTLQQAGATSSDLYREIRANLALLKALNLETANEATSTTRGIASAR